MDGRDDMDAGDGSARVQRACDSCRTRKIRCDRGTPCSNCKASNLSCQTTAPTQKVQRQRVHISDEYERKIDRIEDRLAGIEQVLENLASKLGSLNIQKDQAEQNSQSRSSKVGKSPNSSTDIHANTPAPFEGETTLNVQSEFARELLEKAVGSTPSIGQNIEVQTALASLQGMVSRQGQFTSTRNEPQPLFNKALADIDGTKLERPPWEAVADALDKASIYPTMCFAVVFPFLKMQNLKELFQEAYASPEETSTGRRILVYGVLYNLFTEFACFPLLGQRAEHFKAYSIQCRTQMETAMSQLDLFLPASYENILALLLAASYAVELCKPSVCWIMNSTAAGLCQNLGYHRISSMKDDTEEERSAKINVFWFIYTLDKTLSLRLGRAPAIQDWDMSLPYPVSENKASPIAGVPTGTEMQIYWIKVAQIQGQTYERLFSPAAFLKPQEERAQMAQELVGALNQAWADRGEASVLDFTFLGSALRDSRPKAPLSPNDTELPSKRMREKFLFPNSTQISMGSETQPTMRNIEGSFGDVGDLFYHSDVVVHYSTVTLIQRAASKDNNVFNQDCLESARAALVAHQRCSQQFNTKGNEDLWSGYVHWSILQAPFTPFIVIFCYAISTCSHSDLASLSDFVFSLESCRTVSEGADKLYKLCHLFLQVAKLYVEAKTKEAASEHATPSTNRSNPAHSGARNGSGNYYVTEDGQQLDLDGVNQFDPYLSALGLVPNAAWPMATLTPIQPGLESFHQPQGMEGGGGVSGNQNSVQDWFSGSRYIMGLLEEDINMPDLQNLQ